MPTVPAAALANAVWSKARSQLIGNWRRTLLIAGVVGAAVLLARRASARRAVAR